MPRPPHGPDRQLRWFGFALSAGALAGYRRALSLEGRERALRCLARGISSSHGPSGDAVQCAVADPHARRLAVLAPDDAAARATVAVQAQALDLVCRRLRYVDFTDADRIAAALARRLRRRCGDDLGRYPRAAIPRGGWLVAGLMERHLPPAVASPGSDLPLLVLDDCALTGAALRRFLHRVGRRPVVFAPLFAGSGLAGAVERAEERVEAVIVGETLADRGSERLGFDHASWRRRWRSRLGDEPYWLGLSDFVCFRWSEPRRWVWNPRSRTMLTGWRVLPPELSVAGRRIGAISPRGAAPQGPLRPAARVFWAEVAEQVYVGHGTSGASYRLGGVGARLWRLLVAGGDRKAMLDAMVSGFEVDRETAEGDLGRWLRELVDRGLVERE